MDGYHLVMGDAANRANYEKAADKLGGVDCVYHLAAINGTRWFHERPDFVVQVNLDTLRTARFHNHSWGPICIHIFTRSLWRTTRNAVDQ